VNAVVFGATGMVGSGVLQECSKDPRVRSVLVVGRSSCGVAHPKVREIIRSDFFDYADATTTLAGLDACFFCLGVSVVGLSEAAYRRVTYDLTMAAARALAALNPRMTFCYVSGEWTDSTERGRSMWARVKGETENELLRLPIDAYMLRPGFIQPMEGVGPKSTRYRILYGVLGPLYPVIRRIFPKHVTTTVNIGRAMIALAAGGSQERRLENQDINRLAGLGSRSG
jgi:uncharacterized protein YbjT (DUF2867 family)